MRRKRQRKLPEGAATGAGSGAVIGGALGWLAATGALSFPTLGPLIVAGPIIATLAGIGVGGTLGGVSGALVGLGTPEYEAKRYQGRIEKGGILLSVHCDSMNWVNKAKHSAPFNRRGRCLVHGSSPPRTMTIPIAPCVGVPSARNAAPGPRNIGRWWLQVNQSAKDQRGRMILRGPAAVREAGLSPDAKF